MQRTPDELCDRNVVNLFTLYFELLFRSLYSLGFLSSFEIFLLHITAGIRFGPLHPVKVVDIIRQTPLPYPVCICV